MTSSLKQGTGIMALSTSNSGNGYPVPCSDKLSKTGSGWQVLSCCHCQAIPTVQFRKSLRLPPPSCTHSHHLQASVQPQCAILCPKKNQHILTRGSVTHWGGEPPAISSFKRVKLLYCAPLRGTWGSVLLQAASSASVGLQQLACNHQSLDLTGPLIDLGDPSVAVVAFCRHLCHIAHPTQDLDSLMSD